MAKILIATSEEAHSRMRRIFEPQHRLTFAKTIRDALDAAPGCDIVVCGLEFDESRMFDFFRDLNQDEALSKKPRVGVRFIATDTPDNVIEGLELAARACGAIGLVDMATLDQQLGPERADVELLKLIESALKNGHF